MNAPRGHVAARKILVVVALGQRAGLDRDDLLGAIGLSAEDVADPDAWVPQEAWRKVWERVVAHTGDDALGVRAALGIAPGYFGVIDYAARACRTLGEAVPLAARYFRLANTWGRVEIAPHAEGLRVSRHILGDEGAWLPPQAADFALAAMVRVMRHACAAPVPLTAVHLRRPPPADPAPFAAAFACPIRFLAAEDAVDVPAAALAAPMRAPDPALLALLDAHARRLLQEVEPVDGWAVRARHHVARALSGNDVDIGEIARRLGVSARTLQRRLADEGTSFRAVVDGVRHELACAWLRRGASPGEVAFLLGYSEASAFHRAFVGWTGLPPGAWLRQAGASGQEVGASGR